MTTTAPLAPIPGGRLAECHALVTGSTSGIGAAIARALASEGAIVVVAGREVERGEAVAVEVGGRFVPGDLAGDATAVREFAAAALDALDGRVDLLVNNAAVCPVADTLTLSDADLDTALAVNVRAPHVLVAALVPAMCERGDGAVITVGSWMASVGSPIVGLYSATKAAEQQLSRSWAAEFGPRGVRCNTVAPGVTGTPINDGAGDELDRLAAGTPAGRTLDPTDIARAVVWLASDDAAHVHGITLAVDGGISSTKLS